MSGLPEPGAAPAGTDTVARGGVIHDIGYRHHTGERLGRGYVRRALYVDSLKGAYGLGRSARSKVMPMLLLAAMCLPALVLVIVTAAIGAREVIGGYTGYLLYLQAAISIFVASQSPASVSRDLRFRTMPLYLSRPLERVDYVAAKYAAMASAVFVLIALPLTILFVGAILAELPIGEQLPDYLRALAGAALLGLLLAGLGLTIAATTPRRGLGVAAIIAVLLVLSGVQGIAQGIANSQGDAGVWTNVLSPFTLADGVQVGLLGADSPRIASPGVGAGLAFLLVALLAMVASFAFLLRRYRRIAVS